MGWVTKEQIERAREVNVLDYILTYESDNIKRVGSGYRLKEHESLAVSDKGFYWHSHGIGGKTALDYLTNVWNYGFIESVCLILGEKTYEHGTRAPTESITPKNKPPIPIIKSKPSLERVPFSPPPRNKDNNRVIAYLQSRGIDRDLIMNCIQREVLYESLPYHNAVFVGKDEGGNAKFASIRGTTSSFKCDTDGSDKRYSFILPPNNPCSQTVAVFEAPIDCLSHQTLCKEGFIPNFNGWRLSLGGTSTLALEHFLEKHSEVIHCLVCTDNDEAGEMAAAKIEEMPDITSERSPPFMENDWNDELQAMQKAERTQRIPARKLERG